MTRAEDAIEEAIQSHRCLWHSFTEYECMCGITTDDPLTHRTKAVIAAIRDLSADDLAKLINGKVEQGASRYFTAPTMTTASGLPMQGGQWRETGRRTRVVTPWRPTDGLNGAGAATGADEAATDAQGPA